MVQQYKDLCINWRIKPSYLTIRMIIGGNSLSLRPSNVKNRIIDLFNSETWYQITVGYKLQFKLSLWLWSLLYETKE